MGSDILVLKRSLVRGSRWCKVNGTYIRYLTEEVVPIQFKLLIEVELGKYFLSVPMLVADISDDCILGADLLKKINIKKVFDPIFENNVKFPCSHIISNVPRSLETLFEENSKYLNSSQKKIFAGFLREFQDIFLEDLVSGNCRIFEH